MPARGLMRHLLLVLLGTAIAGFACRRQEPEYRGKSLDFWKAQLHAKTEKERKRAMDALSEMGREGVPPLVDLLETTDRKTQKQVVKVLVEMEVGAAAEISEWAAENPEAQKILEELCLEQQDEGYFIALAHTGPETLPIFEKFVQSDNRKVALAAAAALEEMVPPEEAVPVLKLAQKNPHREVRERATESLRACCQAD